jgi:hypothetical protein
MGTREKSAMGPTGAQPQRVIVTCLVDKSGGFNISLISFSLNTASKFAMSLPRTSRLLFTTRPQVACAVRVQETLRYNSNTITANDAAYAVAPRRALIPSHVAQNETPGFPSIPKASLEAPIDSATG